MADEQERRARYASVAAATAISLACGTNYVFSAWSPTFAKTLEISASDINIIGLCGNLGMYATGVPTGLLIDKFGPRIGVFLGAIFLGCGYFPLRYAYDAGPHAMSVAALSAFSFLTGLGSCMAFSAAIKTSTYNWPEHRGTASAFPLSGFGLSAFFFAFLSNIAFGEDISGFLLLLAIGTSSLNLASIPFTRLMPTRPVYERLPSSNGHYTRSRSESNRLLRRPKAFSVGEASPWSHNTNYISSSSNSPKPTPQVTGLRILTRMEFYQLFALLALCAGVGLMTINNIGNNTKALWRRWPQAVSNVFIHQQQELNVSVLSLSSFAGRFLSGAGSDIIVKRFNSSRFWCLFVASSVFLLAQIVALTLRNPNFLFLLAGLSGLGYGATFGVFPALVADAFGATGLSFNWGCIIFAPVLTGSAFNRLYGYVYDDHSHILNDGLPDCPDGIHCYNLAYRYTTLACIGALALSLWAIKTDNAKRRTQRLDRREA